MATAPTTRSLLDALTTFRDVSGTAYSLVVGDNKRVVLFTGASESTLNIATDLPRGFETTVILAGNGPVNFFGATIISHSTAIKLTPYNRVARIVVLSNESGNNAVCSVSTAIFSPISMQPLTQTEYNTLAVKDPSVLYLITG